MKQKLVIPLILIFIVFLIVIVSAVPAAPSPTCMVTANILNSTYQKAYFNPLNLCNRNIPASYSLKLIINNISTVYEDSSRSCDELYLIGKEISVKLSNLTGYSSNARVIEGDI